MVYKEMSLADYAKVSCNHSVRNSVMNTTPADKKRITTFDGFRWSRITLQFIVLLLAVKLLSYNQAMVRRPLSGR